MWTIIAINIHIGVQELMRTVQMTLDDELIEAVDKIAKELKTTRSAFTRSALREAIKNLHLRQMEAKHRKGYQLHPVTQEEFSIWDHEQHWGNG